MKEKISSKFQGGDLLSTEETSTYDVSDSSDSEPEESKSESSSDEDEYDRSTLVVDLGSHRIKGGFAGDDAPRAVFRLIQSFSGSTKFFVTASLFFSFSLKDLALIL